MENQLQPCVHLHFLSAPPNLGFHSLSLPSSSTSNVWNHDDSNEQEEKSNYAFSFCLSLCYSILYSPVKICSFWYFMYQFVADGVFFAELNEVLTRELAEDGYSGVEVRVTPMRTEIIIRATRTQAVLGALMFQLSKFDLFY